MSADSFCCNNCTKSIEGNRYKCIACHDFDLCEDCCFTEHLPQMLECGHDHRVHMIIRVNDTITFNNQLENKIPKAFNDSSIMASLSEHDKLELQVKILDAVEVLNCLDYAQIASHVNAYPSLCQALINEMFDDYFTAHPCTHIRAKHPSLIGVNRHTDDPLTGFMHLHPDSTISWKHGNGWDYLYSLAGDKQTCDQETDDDDDDGEKEDDDQYGVDMNSVHHKNRTKNNNDNNDSLRMIVEHEEKNGRRSKVEGDIDRDDASECDRMNEDGEEIQSHEIDPFYETARDYWTLQGMNALQQYDRTRSYQACALSLVMKMIDDYDDKFPSISAQLRRFPLVLMGGNKPKHCRIRTDIKTAISNGNVIRYEKSLDRSVQCYPVLNLLLYENDSELCRSITVMEDGSNDDEDKESIHNGTAVRSKASTPQSNNSNICAPAVVSLVVTPTPAVILPSSVLLLTYDQPTHRMVTPQTQPSSMNTVLDISMNDTDITISGNGKRTLLHSPTTNQPIHCSIGSPRKKLKLTPNDISPIAPSHSGVLFSPLLSNLSKNNCVMKLDECSNGTVNCSSMTSPMDSACINTPVSCSSSEHGSSYTEEDSYTTRERIIGEKEYIY